MSGSHANPTYHRSYASINLEAIAHNLRELQSCMGEGVLSLAVVKADAYGHGMVPVSRFLEEKVDYFAVAEVDEGIQIRQGGVKKPILVLSYTSPSQYASLLDYDITATIFNLEDAEALSSLAVQKGMRAKVHVAVDTGMGRIGFMPTEESADIVQKISRLPGILLEGLFSHYACADSADPRDAVEQEKLFDAFLSLLDARDVNIPIKHICNSAGAMNFTKQYDMCRLGIALYGLYPSAEMDREKIKLIPAMEVISHVIHVKTVPEGFKIGYDHIYTAPSPRRIATVGIGYADGFNRCLTEVGYVLINGQKAPIVGKVCMDQIMVDVTDIPHVSVGDPTVVLGESQGVRISAEELGKMCHSFNYEVVCTFMPRVHRVYI